MGTPCQLKMNCDGTAPDASVNGCKRVFGVVVILTHGHPEDGNKPEMNGCGTCESQPQQILEHSSLLINHFRSIEIESCVSVSASRFPSKYLQCVSEHRKTMNPMRFGINGE